MTVTIRNKETGRTSVRYYVAKLDVDEEYIKMEFDRNAYTTITSIRISAADWEVKSVDR